ncbi:alpha/beta hydrolase [Sphingomonas faeni]|uniref:alpha/beta hydrolase n=1 Tax=Sphingomonas faeni TaxID=185950 RepID=UPI00335277D4
MDIQRRMILAGGLALATATRARAQQWGAPATPAASDLGAPVWPVSERILLWPGSPPGAPAVLPTPSATMNGPKGARELWISGIAAPEIGVFRSARPDGSALVVFPGGGYSFLSVQNEGIDAARCFNAVGITVFVVNYRLPGEGWQGRDRVPLQDAQRAMRLVRSRAASYGIDPLRIGVLGFSAGGHLACDAATAFDERTYAPVDAADQLSARPDFAGLIYPVASLRAGVGHSGSRDQLLGQHASEGEIGRRSPAEHTRADMPSCFVMHAMDDETVPVEASFQFIAGCRKVDVPVEAHLFEHGGHGFGFHAPFEQPAARWPELFAAWIRQRPSGR